MESLLTKNSKSWYYKEIILYLWGFSIGLPDIAYNFNDIVNIRIDDFLVVVLFILIFFKGKLREFTLYQKQYLVIFVPLLIFIAISLIWTLRNIGDIDLYPVFRFLGICAAFFTIHNYVDSENVFRRLLFSICFGGFICILLQYDKFIEILNTDTTYHGYRYIKSNISPSTWNANTLGTFCLMLTGFSIINLSLGIKNKIIRFVQYLFLIIFILVPFIGFHRTVAISMIVSFAILFLMKPNRNHIIIISMLLCSVYISKNIFPKAFDAAIEELNLREGRSVTTRTYLWEKSLEFFKENPFGIGYSAEKEYFKRRIGHGVSHNVFLSSFVELGIIGGILYILSVGVWPVLFYKSKKTGETITKCTPGLIFLWLGLLVLGMAMPSIYFEKPGSLTFVIFFSYLGLFQNGNLKTNKNGFYTT